APTPPYEEVIRQLRSLAGSRPTSEAQIRLRDEARGALTSTARDFNGRLYYERYGQFAAHYQNLGSVSSRALDWSDAVRKYQTHNALQTARAAGGRLDGLHLDSTSGMRRWGAVDDYDRRHWAAADLPLTFSYHSGLVTQRGIFPLYGHIADVSDFVHRRRMILSANFNADLRRTAGFFGADRIDYFGIEQGLQVRTKGGTVDQFAMWKRTLAYQRPITTLDARIGMGNLSLTEIDAQIQQNLFYGIFAGAWDPEIEAEATGDEPAWVRDDVATVWGRYTPIFRKLARSGWEPVTHARTSDRAVWVERFGEPDEPVMFTVRNETGVPRPVRLTIDVSALGPGPATRVSAIEEVTRRAVEVALQAGGRRAAMETTIPPRSTRVFTMTIGR
ncbi:MAG: hypothetical protein M3N24_04810, partial [Actinomycetota bacterium]|nr:hypothetical protein [Actinomycetota bacterium]